MSERKGYDTEPVSTTISYASLFDNKGKLPTEEAPDDQEATEDEG